MNVSVIRNIFGAIFLLLLQFFIINEVNFGTIFLRPFVYFYLLLFFPFTTNKYVVLLTGFAMGFVLDAVSNTYGLHTISASFLAYLLVQFQSRFLDVDALVREGHFVISIDYKGLYYFLLYHGIFIFIYHFLFFMLDAFKWNMLFYNLLSAILSSLLTLLFVAVIRLLIQKRP